MINKNHYKIIDDICNKYKVKKYDVMKEVLLLEEHIHLKHMTKCNKTDLDKIIKQSYFYSALGHINNRYKEDKVYIL